MSKRSSLKGKGADIYLASEEKTQETTRPQQGGGIRRKATFYVPSDLLDQLDDAWLDLRRIDRGVKKSDVVTVALEAALGEYIADQKTSSLYQQIIGEGSSKQD
jgi:hypothetical protein